MLMTTVFNLWKVIIIFKSKMLRRSRKPLNSIDIHPISHHQDHHSCSSSSSEPQSLASHHQTPISVYEPEPQTEIKSKQIHDTHFMDNHQEEHPSRLHPPRLQALLRLDHLLRPSPSLSIKLSKRILSEPSPSIPLHWSLTQTSDLPYLSKSERLIKSSSSNKLITVKGLKARYSAQLSDLSSNQYHEDQSKRSSQTSMSSDRDHRSLAPSPPSTFSTSASHHHLKVHQSQFDDDDYGEELGINSDENQTRLPSIELSVPPLSPPPKSSGSNSTSFISHSPHPRHSKRRNRNHQTRTQRAERKSISPESTVVRKGEGEVDLQATPSVQASHHTALPTSQTHIASMSSPKSKDRKPSVGLISSHQIRSEVRDAEQETRSRKVDRVRSDELNALSDSNPKSFSQLSSGRRVKKTKERDEERLGSQEIDLRENPSLTRNLRARSEPAPMVQMWKASKRPIPVLSNALQTTSESRPFDEQGRKPSSHPITHDETLTPVEPIDDRERDELQTRMRAGTALPVNLPVEVPRTMTSTLSHEMEQTMVDTEGLSPMVKSLKHGILQLVHSTDPGSFDGLETRLWLNPKLRNGLGVNEKGDLLIIKKDRTTVRSFSLVLDL